MNTWNNQNVVSRQSVGNQQLITRSYTIILYRSACSWFKILFDFIGARTSRRETDSMSCQELLSGLFFRFLLHKFFLVTDRTKTDGSKNKNILTEFWATWPAHLKIHYIPSPATIRALAVKVDRRYNGIWWNTTIWLYVLNWIRRNLIEWLKISPNI